MSKQFSLFEEENKESNLVISAKREKPLTRAQINFNKLTQNISKLEAQIIEKEKFLIDLLNYNSKNIFPALENHAKDKVDAAFILENLLLQHKFAKVTQNEIIELIQVLLQESFEILEPSKETEELYNRFSITTFEEEKNEQIDHLKDEFADMLKSNFGVDIDFGDLDIENQEDVARFVKELQEKITEGHSVNEKDFSGKKKTKKQLLADKVEKEKLESQHKSLKSVYVSLAKVLHPDTDIDSDPIQKMEKEELMKKVSVAYKERDLSTLLKLELEWVHKTEDDLAKISEEKLNIYCEILKERQSELQNEVFSVQNDPRFLPVLEFVFFNEKRALAEIKRKKQNVESISEMFSQNITGLKELNKKKEIADVISYFHSDFVVDQKESHFIFDDDDFKW